MIEAFEILRKKGQKVAAKRADREANEGVVVALTDGNQGLLLGLGCETDFVAKNEDFIAFANEVAALALSKGCTTKEEVLALEIDGTPVSEKLVERTGIIGERIELSDFNESMARTWPPTFMPAGKLGSWSPTKTGDTTRVRSSSAVWPCTFQPWHLRFCIRTNLMRNSS